MAERHIFMHAYIFFGLMDSAEPSLNCMRVSLDFRSPLIQDRGTARGSQGGWSPWPVMLRPITHMQGWLHCVGRAYVLLVTRAPP